MDDFSRLLAYDAWANREVLATLRKLPAPPPRAVQLLAHIGAAQRLWWERVHPQQSTTPVWPDWTLDESEAQLAATQALWQEYARTLTPAERTRHVAYKNSQGESWSSMVEDILCHVLMHGVYHRGQIATHLRLAGQPAAYTDFIHAVRQGFVE
jgi:uncharacterized damage-inducible protein DinB